MVKIFNFLGKKHTYFVNVISDKVILSKIKKGGTRMKKKIVAVMLSALTAGSLLLTGCGGGSSSSGDSGSGGSGGGDTLTVMCVGTEADTYIDGYNAIAEKFSEDNEYGVTVEIEFYENEQYKTKLTTLMASNAVPDIFFTWELSYLQPFVEGGKVADITSYLEEDQEWKNSFADGTLDLLAYDGKNYGVPTQKSLCVMFYNKQIFEENGVEVPTTYEEFLDVCQTLKDNGVTPMTMCGTDAWIPAQFVQQIAGGMAGDQLFTDVCDGTEPWNNETMDWNQSWKKEDFSSGSKRKKGDYTSLWQMMEWGCQWRKSKLFMLSVKRMIQVNLLE